MTPNQLDDDTVCLLYDALYALHADTNQSSIMQIIVGLGLTDPLTNEERVARTVELERIRREARHVVNAEQRYCRLAPEARP